MSGGAGYVLSKEALIRLVEKGFADKDKCHQGSNRPEDVEIGRCLEKVNVIAGDSRDSQGRSRFLPFTPENHLIPGNKNKEGWFKAYQFYKEEDGMNCCSDNAISFHYMKPKDMYIFEYLIYHLRPYGIVMNSQPLPKKFSIEQTSDVIPN